MLIQFVLVALMGVAFLLTWKRVRQTVLSVREGIVWSLVWGTGAMIAMAPGMTTRAAKLFGVGRGVDFVFYASISLIFLLLFKLFIQYERLERHLTELVRREALRPLGGEGVRPESTTGGNTEA